VSYTDPGKSFPCRIPDGRMFIHAGPEQWFDCLLITENPSVFAAAILIGISGVKRRATLSSRRGFFPVSPGTITPDKIFPAVQIGWPGIKRNELLMGSFEGEISGLVFSMVSGSIRSSYPRTLSTRVIMGFSD
jgi:hypothetical protein